MMAQAIKCLASVSRDPKKMLTSQNERAPKSRVVQPGGREIITEGLHLNFWARHPHTHYGHLIATVELFTGIFSMSLMTGLIFARLRGRLSHSCHVNIVCETSRERAK